MTACAQYLQAKIDESNDALLFTAPIFLHENVLDGMQLQKIIDLLTVPGDLALSSVKALVERDIRLNQEQ